MIETKIHFSVEGLQKFASRDDYISRAEKFLGTRLVKLALNDAELKKRIPRYENAEVRNAAKNATILFNNHVGIVSTVNELETASQVDPEEYVFFRCRAIDAGGFEKNSNSLELHGANDNGDYFSAEELLKKRLFSTRNNEEKNVHAFETFVGKLFFTNHKNDDVGEGKGMIINSYYDLEEHCVYCDIMVDAIANPALARAIQQGYLKDVSMGCAVEWSECSFCGNKANNINEYCDHIKNHKGRKLSGKEVYEINHDLKFIEISAVTEGAFKNCTIDEILSQDEILNTVKDMKNAYKQIPLKTAYQTIENCKNLLTEILSEDIKKVASANSNGMIIEASEEHLGKLYKGLDLIREVIMDMIQLENIDYDYVSDLTKIMKDLQASIFDLASAGFNEESEGIQINPETGQTGGGGIEDKFQQGNPAPPGGNVEQLPQPQKQNIPQKEEFPLAAKKIIRREDLLKISDKLNNVILDCNNVIHLGQKIEDRETIDVKNSYEYDPKNETMTHTATLYPFIMEYDINNDVINTYYHKSLIKSQSLNSINKIAATLLRNDPSDVLEKRIKQYKDHVRSELTKTINSRGNKMNTNKVKTAATDKIIYQQLEEDLGGSNSRHVRDTHEVDLPILEGLLDDLDTTPETGASEYMLEGKIQSGRTSNERINPPHAADKPTGEKQLADANRRSEDDRTGINYGTGEAQFEQRSGEYTTDRHQSDRADELLPITEGQMDEANDLGNKRLEYALLSITEDQMASKREDNSEAPSSGQTKWSGDISKLNITAKDVADLAITALTNAVVKDGISPKRIAHVCSSGNLNNKELTQFNSNNSIQKFSAPLRTEEDIVNRIALRIAEINHNYGLSSSDKNLSSKWNDILNKVVSSFGKDQEKFIRVLSNKSTDYIRKLEAVVAGEIDNKTEEQSVQEQLDGLLDNYLSNNNVEVIAAVMAPEDFSVIDDASEFERILSKKADGDKYIQKAKALLQNLIEENYGVKVLSNDISIQEIDDSDSEIINCKASIDSKYLSKISKKVSEDEEESTEDAEHRDNKFFDKKKKDEKETDFRYKRHSSSEAEAMSKAIKNVFSQQAPGGFVGGPSFGGAQDQQTPPPAGGDAGLGSMSTPPPDDFQPLDGEGGEDGMSSDGEVGTPKLPGMRCPVCGSVEDLENIDNKIRCGECASEWVTKVAVEITKNTALENEGQTSDEDIEEVPEEGTEGEDIQNELGSTPTGAPGGSAPAAPAPPPMASSKKEMKKIAGIPTLIEYTTEPEVLACNTTVVMAAQNRLDGNGEIGYPMAPGHRCPNCGSLHTYCEDSAFQCVACGCKGKFKIAQNKDDGRFADVAISYIGKASVNPPKNEDLITKKHAERIASAESVINKRSASTNLNKPIEESINDVISELRDDGYSLNDANVLRDVIIESMISEKLEKKANINASEDQNMSKQDRTISISTEEETELDQALASSNVSKSSIRSESQVEMLEEKEDYGDENLGGEEDYGSENLGGDDLGDEEGGVEDIVVIDDDEDPGMNEEIEIEDIGEEGFGSGSISIDIDTPDEDVHIEVDEEGHTTIEQGHEEEEFGDEDDFSSDEESPDYFGEEGDEAEEEESEGESLDQISPELDEDFTDEGSESETESEESAPFEAESEEPDNESMSEYSSENNDIKMIQEAALMNTRGIHKISEGFGNTMNWDLVARAMGKSRSQITQEANKIKQAQAIMETKNIDFGNPNEVIRKFLHPKTAQTAVNQTMPLDVEDDVDSGIPRKPEVGFNKVKYNPVRPSTGGAGGGVTEVKTDKYEKGAGAESGGETSVVPRSQGDSGIKGIPKPKFVEEKSNSATSGNPDSYVQKFTPSMKPTPSSSEKNRVRASSLPELTKIAKSNNISVKDIKVKKLGGLYIAAHKNNVWKWGTLEKEISEDIQLEYPEVTVKVSSSGRLTKVSKNKKTVKTAKVNNIVKTASLKKVAKSEKDAVKIFSTAQNVPEEFIEYADFDDEFLVRDTRDPEKRFFKIRKATNR